MGLGMKHGIYASSVGGQAGVITEGLVLHLDPKNASSYGGSGTTWTDLSDQGNNVTLYNSPSYNSDGYFTFDGSNDYAGRDDILGITDWPFTFSSWIRPATDGDGTDSIMGFADDGSNSVYTYQAVASNDKFLVNIRNTGYVFAYLDDDSDVRDGVWYNYVVCFISDTERKSYINGVLNSSYSQAGFYTITTNVNFTTNQDSFDIGRLGRSSHTDYFKGDVSAMMVYDREISQDEVTNNYNALKSRFGY
tara:strand:- start:261 stop:1007 length:747 start_codon:yes stop_codon:yes gene_type:complete